LFDDADPIFGEPQRQFRKLPERSAEQAAGEISGNATPAKAQLTRNLTKQRCARPEDDAAHDDVTPPRGI